ncbi:MAG: Dam family site-specific DNA-(adenine-N6)-methyltransferase [Betaproteobacteria bacterium]|nr:Dam family site-specific DNA-(adenine-N6)-methyltransferase [Betaproteobacteria bacterium]
MNPVLKYRGGKLREIPHFLRYVPDDFDRYIEPFLGGGALYFHMEPARAVLNDINARLMGFYRQLKDQYPEMRGQLDALEAEYERNQRVYEALKAEQPDTRIPNANEDLYYRLRTLYNCPDETWLEGVLYFFINKTAYSGMLRYNRRGDYNVPFGRYKHLNTRRVTARHSELLQRAELFSEDYCQIFSMAEKNDFVFLDPPYDCVFNDYGNIEFINGFDEAEHRRLAAEFRKLPCRALMVVGKTPLTEALYGDYICDEYYKSYSVNIRNRFNSNSIHIVVKNY